MSDELVLLGFLPSKDMKGFSILDRAFGNRAMYAMTISLIAHGINFTDFLYNDGFNLLI